MLVKIKKNWEMAERDATPETVFRNRRFFLKGATGALALGAAGGLTGCFEENGASAENSTDPMTKDPSAGLYPFRRNEAYTLDRKLTAEADATSYCNFYEFGSSKSISRAAQALPIRPWTIAIKGMVEKPFELDIDDLMKKVSLEERLYRHRCVEAWSMAVPWSGFAMKDLVALAKPLSSVRYVKMVTLADEKVMPGLRSSWYPWPYTEGLTIEEATNELAFLVTGIYGMPLPRQNGAPLRLATPWKYGFKSIKSIVAFEFTDQRPVSFWEEIQPSEYGFWANVNPGVPHRRWSQAQERVLGTGEIVPTQMFNGYGEEVAHLYSDLKGERLYT